MKITRNMLSGGRIRHQWSDHPSPAEKKIPCSWTLYPLHTMTCWSSVVNAFVEFRDLMYSVGRIEDGIKKGRIVDIRASIMEKKRIVPDEHVQAMSKERRSKRKSHMARDEPVADFPHSSSYVQVPLADFSSPQKFVRKHD